MRLLLDAMLSPRLAEALRTARCDAIALAEVDSRAGIPDDEVLAIATDLGRALVTDNVRDFRGLAAARVIGSRGGHAGVVYLPAGTSRSLNDTGRLVRSILDVVAGHPGELGLANGEAWI
ncbi:MAG: DUF5615 family PIN-like protein [Actinomycetes bacterium]